MTKPSPETLQRTIPAGRERVWELWTTAEGIASWWSPDGYRTKVEKLELTPGGSLVHTMTADAPEAIAFMEQNGLPLSTTSHKTFTEVVRPERLAYRSTIDFVPEHEPYEHLTVVDLAEEGGRTVVTMTFDPLHDEVWTERVIAGRANELDNLVRLVSAPE